MGEGVIDWNKLELPSDNLTLGAIRRAQPDAFAQEDHGLFEPLERLLAFAILSNEMDLALLSFAEASGQPGPNLLVSRKDVIEQLADDYETVGIGEGPASRQALIRKIESDSAALATLRARRGKS